MRGRHLKTISELKTQNSKLEDETWAELPDLILIDGGVGQLNGALEVLRELRFDHIPTVGVVKGVQSRPLRPAAAGRARADRAQAR